MQHENTESDRTELFMKDRIRVLAAGGDIRQIWCAAAIDGMPGYAAEICGFDREMIPEGLSRLADECGDKHDCLLLPVGTSKREEKVNPSSAEGNSEADKLLERLTSDAIIITGGDKRQTASMFPGHLVVSYTEREDFCLRNAVLTAEGAVQLALEELEEALCGLPVNIIGAGRIGMALCRILSGFGARVSISSRSSRGAAKAYAAGAELSEPSAEHRLIFNTAPAPVLTADVLKDLDRRVLIIDLASAPGGTDFAAAESLGIKALHATGLPGKTAPVTAGEILAGTVREILEEVKRND